MNSLLNESLPYILISKERFIEAGRYFSLIAHKLGVRWDIGEKTLDAMVLAIAVSKIDLIPERMEFEGTTYVQYAPQLIGIRYVEPEKYDRAVLLDPEEYRSLSNPGTGVMKEITDSEHVVLLTVDYDPKKQSPLPKVSTIAECPYLVDTQKREGRLAGELEEKLGILRMRSV